jgi:hypothetical protein
VGAYHAYALAASTEQQCPHIPIAIGVMDDLARDLARAYRESARVGGRVHSIVTPHLHARFLSYWLHL